MATLYYFHDPMCSWCWGFKPIWQDLKRGLPVGVTAEYVVGGLAPDSDQPMPQEMQSMLQATWRRIQQQLGTEFNFDFWTLCKPRRSTYPACRAVLAAKLQGKEEEMITAIQQAYYLNAQNPSDVSTLVGLAAEMGLDAKEFEQSLASADVAELFNEQLVLQNHMPISGFPTLVLHHEDSIYPIQLDYLNAATMLGQIEQVLAS